MGKKILKILVLIVVVLGLISWGGYYYYFKSSPQLQTEIKSEFGEEFFTFQAGEDGNGTPASSSGSTTPTDNNQPPEVGKANLVDKLVEGVKKIAGQDKPASTPIPQPAANQPTLPGQDTQSPSNQAPPPQLTEAEIIAKYQPQLESLQNQSVVRLEELAGAAVQEYKTRQANGTLDKNEMVKKYLQAGYMLEAGVDEAFYRSLNAMQAELVVNGHPTTASQAIENRYASSKAQKRNELLSKAGLR